MNGNDQITVETALEWKFGDNGVQYYYETLHNGERYSLIRNHESDKWFAMKNDPKQIQLVPLKSQKIVNGLVLELEDYLLKESVC